MIYLNVGLGLSPVVSHSLKHAEMISQWGVSGRHGSLTNTEKLETGIWKHIKIWDITNFSVSASQTFYEGEFCWILVVNLQLKDTH